MTQPALATIERSAVPAIGQTRLFINNEWVDPLDGTCFNTLNPATGEVIASVAQGGAADIDRAVQAARRALETPPYSTMDAADRGRLLLFILHKAIIFYTNSLCRLYSATPQMLRCATVPYGSRTHRCLPGLSHEGYDGLF